MHYSSVVTAYLHQIGQFFDYIGQGTAYFLLDMDLL
jgi:hypothetical protein